MTKVFWWKSFWFGFRFEGAVGLYSRGAAQPVAPEISELNETFFGST